MEDYCFVKELQLNNSCQEFLAYTLVKAIDDMEQRFGQIVKKEW